MVLQTLIFRELQTTLNVDRLLDSINNSFLFGAIFDINLTIIPVKYMRLGSYLIVFLTIGMYYTVLAQIPTDTLKASISNPEINPNFFYDGFGSEIDIYNDDAIVAASLDIPSGKAYTYKKQNGQWVYQRSLAPSSYNLILGSKFGKVAVTDSYFATNLAQWASDGTGKTLVDIFKKSEINSAPYQTIELPTYMAYGSTTLAMNNNFLVIGIPIANSDTTLHGKIYIYKLVNETWVKDTVLSGSSGFGSAVYIAENQIVVGDLVRRKIHTFINESTLWQEQTILSAEYSSLHFDSKRIVIANLQNNLDIFEQTDSNQWILKETVVLPSNSGSLYSLKVFGDNIAVAGYPNQLLLVQKSNNRWKLTQKYILNIPISSNIYFSPVAVYNQSFMVGTPNLNQNSSGSVFYGILPSFTCSDIQCIPVKCTIIRQ